MKETEPKLAAAKKEALTEKQKDEEAAERARIEQREREEKERIEREEREEKERIEREKAEQEAKEKAAKADKITRIVLGVAAAVIAVVLLITKVIIPSSNYSKAEELLAAGDYDGAITVFEKVGSYKDAAERKNTTKLNCSCKRAIQHMLRFRLARLLIIRMHGSGVWPCGIL